MQASRTVPPARPKAQHSSPYRLEPQGRLEALRESNGQTFGAYGYDRPGTSRGPGGVLGGRLAKLFPAPVEDLGPIALARQCGVDRGRRAVAQMKNGESASDRHRMGTCNSKYRPERSLSKAVRQIVLRACWRSL